MVEEDAMGLRSACGVVIVAQEPRRQGELEEPFPVSHTLPFQSVNGAFCFGCWKATQTRALEQGSLVLWWRPGGRVAQAPLMLIFPFYL